MFLVDACIYIFSGREGAEERAKVRKVRLKDLEGDQREAAEAGSEKVLRIGARVRAARRPADKKAVRRKPGIGAVPEELTERKENSKINLFFFK